jgi:hypothetical protein
MNACTQPSPVAAVEPLLDLIDLSRKARTASSAAELAFLAVNDSHRLHPYRQAALWTADSGIQALSGVIEPEANAPYAQWLTRLCQHLSTHHHTPCAVEAIQLPEALAVEWVEWLPPHGLWLPFPPQHHNEVPQGGLLLAADQAWPDDTRALMTEWIGAWHHAWHARARPAPWSWRHIQRAWSTRAQAGHQPTVPWRRRAAITMAVIAVMLIPVQLSVLAPGELVPANPAVIRAPLDGVVGQFHVQPNQQVKAGQALFSFDRASLAARHEVAAQALATAQAEYRQSAQQAVSDTRFKTQLSPLLGKIEERRAEADYVKDQFQRATVTAPHDGIALFDDPSEWIGKPVQTGERIMRIATPQDVEVEAWLPIGDAIALNGQAQVKLYLAAHPLTPLAAQVRYVAHDAVLRPDGVYAYRVRASLTAPTDQRVGLQGTAKLSGETVPLVYWMLRRPIATLRQTLGW